MTTEDLILNYRPLTFKIARGYFRSHEGISYHIELEEYYADALPVLVKAAQTFDGRGTFGGWLSFLLDQHFCHVYKKLCREKEYHDSTLLSRLEVTVAQGLPAYYDGKIDGLIPYEEAVLAREEPLFEAIHSLEMLHDFLSTLEEHERALIEYRLKHLSYAECGRLLSASHKRNGAFLFTAKDICYLLRELRQKYDAFCA